MTALSLARVGRARSLRCRHFETPPFAITFRLKRDRQRFIGSADNEYLSIGCQSACGDNGRFFRDEAVVLDDLANLRDSHGISGLQLQDRQPVVKADAHLRDRRHFLHRHAHGVGAHFSIHSQRFHFHMEKLCASTARNEQGEPSQHSDVCSPHWCPFGQKK